MLPFHPPIETILSPIHPWCLLLILGAYPSKSPSSLPLHLFFLHTPAPFPTTLLIHFQLDIHYLTMPDTISTSPRSFSLTSEHTLPPFAPSVLLTRPLIALISTTLPLSIPLPLHPFAHAYYHPIPLPYAKPESRPFLLQRQTTISSKECIRHPTTPHLLHFLTPPTDTTPVPLL